jgi:hypothetical protein
MRSLIAISIIFAFILGCNSQKTMSDKSVAKNDTVKIANDSLGYEVNIIDAGFNSWLAGHAYPRNFYSQGYLEAKNRVWVYEWNIRATNPQRYRDLYDMQIDYSPTVNYGYEVNYLLYNYLVYFQNKFGQKLGGHVPDR